MRRKLLTNALIALVAVILTLLLLEVGIRLAGTSDADGRLTFMRFILEAPDLPLNQLRGQLDNYLANQDAAVIIYDKRLGWTYRPNAILHGGKFTTNGAGLRSPREFSERPPADTLRIALFGDSFTAGDDVGDDEVWGQVLEDELNAAGIRAELLNFGVGGYGMGQAFLRWQHVGRNFAPDIVIFGFQPENLNRNVNLFRPLYHRDTGIPFSKPRYILRDGALDLVNFPAIAPARLIAVYEDFGSHPLAEHEFFYTGGDLFSNWWSFSKLAVIVQQVIERPIREGNIDPDGEREKLGRAIIDAFAEDVSRADAGFLIVHLPDQLYFVSRLEGAAPRYADLIDYLEKTYSYLPSEAVLWPNYVEDRFWGPTHHYGPEMNQVVGQAVAEAIKACISELACPLPRFEGAITAFQSVSAGDA